jgi:hypothetical protein
LDEAVWHKIPKSSQRESLKSEESYKPEKTGNAITNSIKRLSRLKFSDGRRSSTVGFELYE